MLVQYCEVFITAMLIKSDLLHNVATSVQNIFNKEQRYSFDFLAAMLAMHVSFDFIILNSKQAITHA